MRIHNKPWDLKKVKLLLLKKSSIDKFNKFCQNGELAIAYAHSEDKQGEIPFEECKSWFW